MSWLTYSLEYGRRLARLRRRGRRRRHVRTRPRAMITIILVPRAYDPSGLRQESRALGATMRHRCRQRETGWAEFGYFLCYFKMVAPRALDSCRKPEGS